MEVLKEAQITSWWSTYHQKRKRRLFKGAVSIPSCKPAYSTPSFAPVRQSISVPNGSSVHVQQSTSVLNGSSVPVQQSTSVPNGSSVPVRLSTSVSQGSTDPELKPTSGHAPGSACIQPTSFLTGYSVPGVSDVLQWPFPANFCHSSLGGRSASNACTFIALYFGHLYSRNNFALQVHSLL